MPEIHHPAVRPCVVVSVTAFTLFLAISVAVRQQNPLTDLDAQIANTLHENQVASPAWTRFFRAVKELAGLEAIVGGVVVVALALFAYGRYWLGLAWGVAVESVAVLNDHVLKTIFQRPRPPFGRPRSATDWSFPSGHSVRAFVMYGLLAYLLVVVLPRRWARIVAVALLALTVALVGFSRIYLGKHYCSDVCGAFAFGAAWIAGWIGLIEFMGWWRGRRSAAVATSGEIAPGTSPNPSTL